MLLGRHCKPAVELSELKLAGQVTRSKCGSYTEVHLHAPIGAAIPGLGLAACGGRHANKTGTMYGIYRTANACTFQLFVSIGSACGRASSLQIKSDQQCNSYAVMNTADGTGPAFHRPELNRNCIAVVHLLTTMYASACVCL